MDKEFSRRRNNLFELMPNSSIAVVAAAKVCIRNADCEYHFRQDSNFWYLTGIDEPEMAAVFVKDRQGQSTYLLFMAEQDPKKIVWVGKRPVVKGVLPLSKFKATMKKLSQNKKIINVKLLIQELRLYKSPYEIKLIREACDITVAGHKKLIRYCKPGINELELERIFINHCYAKGTRHQAYTPIVAGGDNACTLHYVKNNTILAKNDLVLVDAGCEVEYYASDVTRVFPVKGKFTGKQKLIYQLVLMAQLAGIAQIKPGNKFSAVQDAIVPIIQDGLLDLKIIKNKKDYKKFYMHSSGHWLGLDVHDVGGYKNKIFAPNMILTVEPGIYWNGIGIRIEDDILVTKTGCEVLTEKLPKTIDAIEKLMQHGS